MFGGARERATKPGAICRAIPGATARDGFSAALTQSCIGRLKVGGVPWSEGQHNDPTIEACVQRLHQMLATDPAQVRAQIDAHLLAYHVSNTRPSRLLVLRREDTFHYHNLPDLTRFLRDSISSSNWSNNLLAMFMAPFCLQVKRHVNRRIPEQAPTAHRCALINLLHGLLLGLYPFNLQHATFKQRTWVAGQMRAVLCSGAAEQMKFIFKHEALIVFAMAEYLTNILPDFCPVEYQLLIRSPQARYSLNQVCETFRAAAMALNPESRWWDELQSIAVQQLPLLLRQLKAGNFKLGHCAIPYQRIPSQTLATLASDDFINTLMAMPLVPVASCNMIAQISLVRPDLTFAQLQAVECFWNNVFIYPLPSLMLDMQQTKLTASGCCSLLQHAFTHVHICLPCALTTKTSALNQKFAFNSLATAGEKSMLCSMCSKPATCINLLGRLLRIRDTNYLMCPYCLRATIWTGSFDRCARCRPVAKPISLSQCAACDNKAIDVISKVLDIEHLRLVQIPVCGRHAKRCIMSKSTVYDVKMLVRDLHQHE